MDNEMKIIHFYDKQPKDINIKLEKTVKDIIGKYLMQEKITKPYWKRYAK